MPTWIEAAGLFLLTRAQPASFLLMRHRDRWDLPKGHAEAGETTIDTALRETREETGIAADAIEVDPDFQFVLEYEVRGKERGDYHKRVTYLLGFVPERLPVRLTEHVGFEWFPWPHEDRIQAMTIDPVMAAVQRHLTTDN